MTLPSRGGSSKATAINDNGVIVGNNAGLPVRWTSVNAVWQIATFPGGSGSAEDVNAAGDAVGVTSPGATNSMAQYWPASGGNEVIGSGWPRAVNDAGVVVGMRSGGPDGGATAWTRTGGVWTAHVLARQAGVTEGFNEVDDISNDGVIVGFAQDANGVQHAVKWVPTGAGEWHAAVPLDAAAAAGNSFATGIEGFVVVGGFHRCLTGACPHRREAWSWSLDGAGTGSLGLEDGWPDGLNGQGYAVGVFFSGAKRGTTKQSAALWAPGASVKELALPNGVASGWALDINNATATRSSKQAVGEGSNKSGTRVALLWTIP